MIRHCLVFLFMLGMAAGAVAADHEAEDAERQVLVMLRIPPPHFRPDAVYSGRYTDDAGRASRRRVAEDIARRYGLKMVSDWPMPSLGLDCYVMEGTQDRAPAQIADQLSKDARVEWAQPIHGFRGMGYNDPLYPVQPVAKYWHLESVHKVTTGHDVKVAIVDSGVDAAHPDLAGQVLVSENFVEAGSSPVEAHGTGVAGIVAAHVNNGVGIAGVAPGVRLMALRACWEADEISTRCNSFTLGKALNFAIMHDARIINMSLSGPQDRLLQRLIDEALSRGIAVVAAFDDHSDTGGFPASCSGVVAVASQESGQGGKGVLRAPGKDVPTTTTQARWGFVSGSSYAAAHVSGLLALLSEQYPDMKPSQLKNKIAVFAAGAPAAEAGTVDMCASLGPAEANCACACAVALGRK